MNSKVKRFRCFRSSEANDVFKPIYGSYVPVLEDEKFSLRILVSSKSPFFHSSSIELRLNHVWPFRLIIQW